MCKITIFLAQFAIKYVILYQIFKHMDFLQQIKSPIQAELEDFNALFKQSLEFDEGLLSLALKQVREGQGKRMRPILLLLIAKNFGKVTDVTLRAAVSLELLHTASLVHDDVVDESNERRGKPSMNAAYGNKVAVLVGDYILSTALQRAALSGSYTVVNHLAELGKMLSDGEIRQLNSIKETSFSEENYFDVIGKKTASLFEKCALLGAETVGATDEQIKAAREFGYNIGIIFQIRDDIFDYFKSEKIGKPTGNDMREGKLTLPVIYALKSKQDEAANMLASKVKKGSVTEDEIAQLVEFTKVNGGIDYAEKTMLNYYSKACNFVDKFVKNAEIKQSLQTFLDFMIKRNY